MTTELVWMGHFADLPRGPYVPGWAFYGRGTNLSARFRTISPCRDSIVVILPDRMLRGYGSSFCIDQVLDPEDPDSAWEIQIEGPLVVGERPDISLVPVIDVPGTYKGFLKHGVLSDDMVPAVAYV